MLKIFIANITEGSATYIRGIKNEEEKQRLIKEDQGLSDRCLFSASDDTILITPWKLNEEFVKDSEQVLNLKNFRNWSPSVNTVSLCKDIEEDKVLFKELVETIKNEKIGVQITSYCNTPEFLGLMLELGSRGCNFEAPDAPSRDFYWTVSFLDSKGGFRQIVQMVSGWEKDLKMPWGVICAKPTEARKIGQILFLKDHGFVVKTNWGQAGEGLIIVRRHNGFATYNEASKFLKDEFAKEDYWEKYPIIVEEFIPPDLSVGGGAPNVECYIAQNGDAQVNYTCGMRVTRNGNFMGIEIGKDVFSDEVEKKIRKIGEEVGEIFSSFGLRGFYEVDMQPSLDGSLYCLESNIRRTGGTHVYDSAKRLFGEDFFNKKYLVSNNNYLCQGLNKLTYQSLKELLSEIWYKDGVGFLPTIINSLPQNVLGYIVVGESKEEAYKLESRLKEIFDRKLRD